jgi:hypothetical protein
MRPKTFNLRVMVDFPMQGKFIHVLLNKMLSFLHFISVLYKWGRFWYRENYQHSQPTPMGRESLWCNPLYISAAVQH